MGNKTKVQNPFYGSETNGIVDGMAHEDKDAEDY